ncbi:hypothetical protein PROFUN_13036 [Planoprotostelium fungivorum]|uniref:Major facilitator superfamily (MFS) profile domain-containing protein n=1 Tax=Planoprotostelium fungivorum TaxID=1890364 RepID=A0A2P6N5L3_9EUKA|nr:hypothetical protein PROFUN_13036 [Planoprotostelium fungivorum]
MDFYLVPIISVLYLASFLDRANIGNARLAGLESDLNLSDEEYAWSLSIFFVGIMAAMAGVTNAPGLIIARFFLGAAEAGLFPGMLYYLSLWYRRKEMAVRSGIFFGAAVAAGAFGGVLAYGIVRMNGFGGLTGWQWLFIIEGLGTVVLAIISYFMLPSGPDTFLLFTERERQDAGVSSNSQWSWSAFRSTFTDWQVALYCMIYVPLVTPLYSLSFFLPTLVKGMGYQNLTANLMSAPPYLIALLGVVSLSFTSDRWMERGFHVALPAFLASLGFLCLILFSDSSLSVVYFFTCLTARNAVLALILKGLFTLENKRRVNLDDTRRTMEIERLPEPSDKHPDFQYIS